MYTIKITNSSSNPIRFSLNYFLNGRLVSKSTPNFNPGNIGQLELPVNALSIVLTVSIFISGSHYKSIYTEPIYSAESIWYLVRGSSKSAHCTRVPCHNLYNSCHSLYNPCRCFCRCIRFK
ncbi:hypothetical protein [Clostridium botulinum]|uniref:hypothetical protein n=1 Tax=Clostridium botulinum TaxID=1491 RepID=UPI00115E2329|nr:hypothetical protein [Clostridium botulinum]